MPSVPSLAKLAGDILYSQISELTHAGWWVSGFLPIRLFPQATPLSEVLACRRIHLFSFTPMSGGGRGPTLLAL